MSIAVGHFESNSRPGTFYDVIVNDDNELSCNCRGWTQQTHFPDCPAVEHGEKCTCRQRHHFNVSLPKNVRTCTHLRDVQEWIERSPGGLPALVARTRELRHAPLTRPWPHGIAQGLREQALHDPTPTIRSALTDALTRNQGIIRQETERALADAARDQLRNRMDPAYHPPAQRRRQPAQTEPPAPPSAAALPNTRAMRIRNEDDE